MLGVAMASVTCSVRPLAVMTSAQARRVRTSAHFLTAHHDGLESTRLYRPPRPDLRPDLPFQDARSMSPSSSRWSRSAHPTSTGARRAGTGRPREVQYSDHSRSASPATPATYRYQGETPCEATPHGLLACSAARARVRQLEPPTADQVDRYVRSALFQGPGSCRAASRADYPGRVSAGSSRLWLGLKYLDCAVSIVDPEPITAANARRGVAAADDGRDAEFAGDNRGMG